MTRANELSATGRDAIRAAADNTADDRAFLADLDTQVFHRLGLFTSTDDRRDVLTAEGRRVHAEIMASGDGPESLKELLRF